MVAAEKSPISSESDPETRQLQAENAELKRLLGKISTAIEESNNILEGAESWRKKKNLS